ncbi:hypothetical protein D3C73_848310 [compost metagenome]
MELYEFHVGKLGAGTGGEHDALPVIAARGRGRFVKTAKSARGENDPRCRNGERPRSACADKTGQHIICLQQAADFDAFHDCDRWCAANLLHEGVHNRGSRSVAGDMGDAVP